MNNEPYNKLTNNIHLCDINHHISREEKKRNIEILFTFQVKDSFYLCSSLEANPRPHCLDHIQQSPQVPL